MEILSEDNRILFDKIFEKYKTQKEDVIKYVKANRPVNNVTKKFIEKNKLILVQEQTVLVAQKSCIRLSTTTINKVIVNKQKKQVWFINGKQIRQTYLQHLHSTWHLPILHFMGDEYEWISDNDVSHSLGYIWKRNYSNPTDYYRKENLIKTNYLWARQESTNIFKVSKNWDFLKTNFKLLENVPNLRDLVRFAYILDEKIDWNWSKNRFEQQHDDWSIKIQNLNLLFEQELETGEMFYELETDDFILIKSIQELIYEGARQHHCVGTYSSNINRGQCAIFVYKKDWTCEVSNQFTLRQIKGKFNSNPPQEITVEVQNHLKQIREKVLLI